MAIHSPLNKVLLITISVESLIKRKDLPEWEVNIEGSNVKDNELLQTARLEFTLR